MGHPDPLDYEESSRGERQSPGRQETSDFADEADRLERHNAPAGDSAGVTGPGNADEDTPAGRDADVARGDAGDAANN
jgi:hypothetical protein